jgi:hypothetical protein
MRRLMPAAFAAGRRMGPPGGARTIAARIIVPIGGVLCAG